MLPEAISIHSTENTRQPVKISLRKAGVSFPEPLGLSLLDVPLTLSAIPLPNGNIQYDGAFSILLNRKKFYDLLTAITPGTPTSEIATLIDWTNPLFEEEHIKTLGKPWVIFRDNLPTFIEILKQSPDERQQQFENYSVSHFRSIIDQPLLGLQQLDDMRNFYLYSAPDLSTPQIGMYLNRQFRPTEASLWKNALHAGLEEYLGAKWYKKFSPRKRETFLRTYPDPDAYQWYFEKVDQFRTEFLARWGNTSPEQLINLLSFANNRGENNKTAPNFLNLEYTNSVSINSGGAIYQYQVADEAAIAVSGSLVEPFSIGVNPIQQFRPNQFKTQLEQSLKIQHIQKRPATSLEPLLSWTTTPQGDRTWNYDTTGKKVTGFLLMTYAAHAIRANFRRRVGLKGREKSQNMGQPQVPVYAMMFEKSILGEPFVAALELLTK